MDREQFAYFFVRRLRTLGGDAKLAKLGRVLPVFRLREAREADPWDTVARAAALFASHGLEMAGVRLLLVGCGASNGLGYAAAAMGAALAVCQDDTAGFDVAQDAIRLSPLVARFPKVKFTVVKRAAQLDRLPAGHFDACLSLATAQDDPAVRIAGVRRLLVADGRIVHMVDFREPLVHYPYHRLLFPLVAGKRLSGRDAAGPWRCDDHIAALTAAGFDVDVAHYESDAAAFAAVADRLHPDYAARDRALLAVTQAVLVGGLRRPKGAVPLLGHPCGGQDVARTPSQGEG